MTRSGLIEALKIVSKYEVEDEFSLCAEHDVLYIAQEIPGITKEDRKRLKELGFTEDKSEGWKGYT